MARFVARRGLNSAVAHRIVVPRIRAMCEAGAEESREQAPGTKTWITMGDALVRETHRPMHGQEKPENAKYEVISPEYDQAHYGVGPIQLADRPRDRSLSPGAAINCRCRSVPDPDAIARTIDADQVTVTGDAVVRGGWRCNHPQGVDANDGGGDWDGARFMEQGIAAALRALK